MSLLQELGAQLRATSDDLPMGLVTAAMEKLRAATELIRWVQEESSQDIGVARLGHATEHVENAAAALRGAQEALDRYLAVLGLTGVPGAPAGQEWREGLRREEERPRPERIEAERVETLGPWWQRRVAELTGEQPPGERSGSGEPPDSAELLRRIAAGVRSGDRARLGRELHAVNASTGLGLSAVTPPVLHRLAGDLLGHDPRPEDVPRLRTAAEGRVRALLPGTEPGVLETLLDRICRVPVKEQQEKRGDRPPGHPADTAVTASVLTGILLARLGRDADALSPDAPEPARSRPGAPEDDR
ncbi:hypothetical protein FHR83_002640 [Actinoplanes campanulatus]|uniref:Uncharacterized protein n=1 Tax=Actinoplanes campanulatus TaxID=113559 RepID=A0A7W5FE52_9ACTN|nr:MULTISPECIES: hypothetical protein [Actinoplanes]MBB3094977.1 hypothetical protein [Actinoplanes campanulatus]GGN08688.1 hypothetical protein GCM10010109_17660 [Actinoplanes campanulatus]GID36272.1 hypothetical protein Aca09nite_27780 [Actinoplanes campanulatus]GID50597.1 hypothetical protein Aca07nite_78720 [Actinoplanes capillaceus]